MVRILGTISLALVFAVILPKFLNLQKLSSDCVAGEIANQLNRTYASWKASGGTVSGVSYGSVILDVLSGASGTTMSVPTPDGAGVVADSGTSQNVRVSLPSTSSPNLNPNDTFGTSPTNVVAAGDYIILYNTGTDSFTVAPGNATSLAWSSTGWTSDVTPSIMSGIILNAAGEVKYLSYAVQKNGIYFGVLSPLNRSGSLYAYDESTDTLYRATYNGSVTASLEKSDGENFAVRNFAPFKRIGSSTVSDLPTPLPTISWVITYDCCRLNP